MLGPINFSAQTSQVVLAPHIWVAVSGAPPGEIIPFIEGYKAFAGNPPNVWFKDPGTGMFLPFWAPEDVYIILRAVISDSHSRFNAIPACSPAVERWLRQRRMVMGPVNAHHSSAAKDGASEALADKKYTVLRDIFPAPVMEMLTARMRELQKKDKLFQCTQVPERSAFHNDPMMHYFHLQMNGYLNQIMVEKIKASYVFSVIYHEGAILHRHVDRPQCRWNLSLMLGSTPEVTMDTTWPIYLEIDGKAIEVRLMPGDAVLYSGTDIPHWRDAQPTGLECVVSFFHFVDQNFTSELH